MKHLAPARYKVTFTASAEPWGQTEATPGAHAFIRARRRPRRYYRRGSDRKARETRIETLWQDQGSQKELGRNRHVTFVPLHPGRRTSVKRAVYERDGQRCVFVDENGCRCSETEQLEFHHLHPFGQGGDHRPANIELRCKAHNLYQAERDYGKEVMEKYRRSTGRISEPAAVYTYGNRATPAL